MVIIKFYSISDQKQWSRDDKEGPLEVLSNNFIHKTHVRTNSSLYSRKTAKQCGRCLILEG